MIFKKVVAANWKMNKHGKEAAEFFGTLKSKNLDSDKCEIIVFPPFTLLDYVVKECKLLGIKVGGQNCHFEKSGAFTGEISADMLKDIGAQYVILGHSERRTYFFETDEVINQKIKSALECNLKVVLCVGESLEIRQNKNVHEFISEQLGKGLQGLSRDDLANIIIAYEPIWAIGSGLTMKFDEANEIGRFIKDFVNDNFGCDIRVLYGGSVNAENASGFLSLENIDGALVGGASLKAESFAKIVDAAK